MQNPIGMARVLAVLVVVFAVVLVIHFFSKDSDVPPGLVELGEITATNGVVEHRWPESVEFLPVKKGGALHAGELVRTGPNSKAALTFRSGARVEVGPNSQLVAQYDAAKQSAVRATLVSGEARVTSEGQPGFFTLIHDGVDITQGETTEAAVVDPTKATAPSDQQLITAMTPPERPSATPVPRAAPREDLSSGKLSDDEIRRGFSKNGGFFQRCYLSHLSRSGRRSNSHLVTVGFVIQPTGKVAQAKIVRSEFDDQTLNNCVVETIERTSFRPFKGDPIPVLEFPVELK